MCTPASSDILIVSTVLGSLFLYDLKDFESNPNISLNFNYIALIEKLNPKFGELDEYKR